MTTRYCAAAATLVIAAVGVFSWLAASGTHHDLSAVFTPEHVALLDMHDSSAQQRSHRIVVAAVALVSVLGAALYAGPRWRSGAARGLQRAVSAIDAGGALLVVFALAVLLRFQFPAMPRSSYPLLQGGVFSIAFLPSPRAYLLGLVGALFLVLAVARFANHLATTSAARAIWIGIMSYAAFLMLPGLIETPNLSRFAPELITGVEWHYSVGLGQADRLAAGQKPFTEVQLYNAPLLVTLLAIVERAFGHFSVGAHIRIVQLFQVAFVVVMIAAQWRWNRFRPLAVLVAFLMVAPWVHTYHAAVLYPNQSAWRSLGLPLGALALLHLGPRRRTGSRVALGMCAGLLLLLNLEIGLCIAAGYLVFLVATLNPRGPARVVRVGIAFVAGLAMAMVAFVVVVRAGLGSWPVPSSVVQDLIRPLVRVSGGYTGLPLTTIEPLPALVFLHAVYLVCRSALQWAKGPLPFRSAFKGAIGTVMLLWFAYYVRAPHFWNFWTFLFLYGLLVADYLDPRLLSVFWRRLPRLSYAWRPLILALVILPGLLLTNVGAIDAVGRGVSRLAALSRRSSVVVSGVQLPEEFARSLLRKAASLEGFQSRHPRSGVVYFSANSYMLPLLTGFYPRLPFQDAFFETITNHDFERLVSWTIAMSPEMILFDIPGSALAGYREQQRFFERLRAALGASYASTHTTESWEVWERTVRAASGDGHGPVDTESSKP